MNEYWQEVARDLILIAKKPGFWNDEDALPTWVGQATAVLTEAVRVSETSKETTHA